jgi:hypothetical protein
VTPCRCVSLHPHSGGFKFCLRTRTYHYGPTRLRRRQDSDMGRDSLSDGTWAVPAPQRGGNFGSAAVRSCAAAGHPGLTGGSSRPSVPACWGPRAAAAATERSGATALLPRQPEGRTRARACLRVTLGELRLALKDSVTSKDSVTRVRSDGLWIHRTRRPGYGCGAPAGRGFRRRVTLASRRRRVSR